METENQICRRYEVAFAAIAALDRRYYLTPSASLAERREYAARQVQLQEMRSRLYAELAICRQRDVRQYRHCRCMTRLSRRPSRQSP